MPPERSPEDLLAIEDVAKHFGVSVKYFRDKLSAGDMPEPTEYGGLTRWRWGTLQEWVLMHDLAKKYGFLLVRKSAEKCGNPT